MIVAYLPNRNPSEKYGNPYTSALLDITRRDQYNSLVDPVEMENPMKRTLYVLVPLLMTLLILISIGWYLLEYDPTFTRDLLLQQARYQDELGNHKAAVWFYDIAYRQSNKDDNVAMELAHQYLSVGNYTKAEYTLSNAIADGASIDLYIALCQTYVAQNKLLDAVTMLNNIADPNIKSQLDAMRPTAPVPTYAPGTYSQYINLGFSSSDGTCYLNTDRRYPSLQTDLFEEPHQLAAGETVFYGLTVSDKGLVSPLAVYIYIVGGVVEEVHFTDAALGHHIRQQLGYSEEQIIHSNELWEITELIIPSAAVDYSDLKWFPKLQSLTIAAGNFTTLSPLSQLTQLHTLHITDSVVSSADLKVIASLPDLTYLTLSNCQLSSIANLSGAKNLQYLDISNNTVRDLAALSGMKHLKTLNLAHNAVVSLESITGITTLETLDVSYNSLTSTAPIGSLFNLINLDISYNGLMNLSGIEKLTGLQDFRASNNNLISIEAIAGCTGLIRLNVANNTLLNIDPVVALLKLEELDFSYNEVSQLPAFDKSCALWTINGSHNLIQDLVPLSGLPYLSYVYMDYNTEIRSADSLQKCYMLLTVSVYGTKVKDVSVLQDMNVKVYYDPT